MRGKKRRRIENVEYFRGNKIFNLVRNNLANICWAWCRCFNVFCQQMIASSRKFYFETTGLDSERNPPAVIFFKMPMRGFKDRICRGI